MIAPKNVILNFNPRCEKCDNCVLKTTTLDTTTKEGDEIVLQYISCAYEEICSFAYQSGMADAQKKQRI